MEDKNSDSGNKLLKLRIKAFQIVNGLFASCFFVQRSGTNKCFVRFIRSLVSQKKLLGHFQATQEAEIWYADCTHKYKINQDVMVGGR